MSDTSASLACALAQTEREPVTPPDQITMYRRCKCKTLPGRACPACLEQKFQKCCLSCFGLGTLQKQTREGAQPRTERCGKCMGSGWIPCPKFEIPAAEQEEKAVLAGVGPELETEDGVAEDSAPSRRRASKHKE